MAFPRHALYYRNPSESSDLNRQLKLVDLIDGDVEELNSDGRVGLPREIDEAVLDVAGRDHPIPEVLRGMTVDDALKEMEFTPLIAPQVEELSPPTPEELRILREEIDPDRAIIGSAGE